MCTLRDTMECKSSKRLKTDSQRGEICTRPCAVFPTLLLPLLLLSVVGPSHACLQDPTSAYKFTGTVCRLTYPAAVVCEWNFEPFLALKHLERVFRDLSENCYKSKSMVDFTLHRVMLVLLKSTTQPFIPNISSKVSPKHCFKRYILCIVPGVFIHKKIDC